MRNVIPLAQPGNVVFLDAVTRTSSRATRRTLAPFLAANGVGRLVVRNDLERFQTGAPDPAYVAACSSESPGSRWPIVRTDGRLCAVQLRRRRPSG